MVEGSKHIGVAARICCMVSLLLSGWMELSATDTPGMLPETRTAHFFRGSTFGKPKQKKPEQELVCLPSEHSYTIFSRVYDRVLRVHQDMQAHHTVERYSHEYKEKFFVLYECFNAFQTQSERCSEWYFAGKRCEHADIHEYFRLLRTLMMAVISFEYVAGYDDHWVDVVEIENAWEWDIRALAAYWNDQVADVLAIIDLYIDECGDAFQELLTQYYHECKQYDTAPDGAFIDELNFRCNKLCRDMTKLAAEISGEEWSEEVLSRRMRTIGLVGAQEPRSRPSTDLG